MKATTRLQGQNPQQNYIAEFGGYHHRPAIGEQEFYDMKNLSADAFPLVATRKHRGTLQIKDEKGAELDNVATVQSGSSMYCAFTREGYIGYRILGTINSQGGLSKRNVDAADLPQEGYEESLYYSNVTLSSMNAAYLNLLGQYTLLYLDNSDKMQQMPAGAMCLEDNGSYKIRIPKPHPALELAGKDLYIHLGYYSAMPTLGLNQPIGIYPYINLYGNAMKNADFVQALLADTGNAIRVSKGNNNAASSYSRKIVAKFGYSGIYNGTNRMTNGEYDYSGQHHAVLRLDERFIGYELSLTGRVFLKIGTVGAASANDLAAGTIDQNSEALYNSLNTCVQIAYLPQMEDTILNLAGQEIRVMQPTVTVNGTVYVVDGTNVKFLNNGTAVEVNGTAYGIDGETAIASGNETATETAVTVDYVSKPNTGSIVVGPTLQNEKVATIYIRRPHGAIRGITDAVGNNAATTAMIKAIPYPTETRLWLAEYDPVMETLGNQNPTNSADRTIYGITNLCAAGSETHRAAMLGDKLAIWPEKIAVELADRNGKGFFTKVLNMELTNSLVGSTGGAASNEAAYAGGFAMHLTDVNGRIFRDVRVVGEPPEMEGTEPYRVVWIDTTTEPPSFKVKNRVYGGWEEFQPYLQISGRYVSPTWREHDSIKLELSSSLAPYIRPAKEQKFWTVSHAGTINAAGAPFGSIVYHQDDKGTVAKGARNGVRFVRFPCAFACPSAGMISCITADQNLTLRRIVPEMDFVIESGNRLWGCRYGMQDGEYVNEIYASRFNDPCNWYSAENSIKDSYLLKLGDTGAFTGAANFQGTPVFFRENRLHCIYGTYPANYQPGTLLCDGIAAGSGNSAVELNGVLYYHAQGGIMAYTGGIPALISAAFGGTRYHDAVAGALNSKAYFSMLDEDDHPALFVFDDRVSQWHKEDDLRAEAFLAYHGTLFAITSTAGNNGTIAKLHALRNQYGTAEGAFDWMLESGAIGYTTPNRKTLQKVTLRLRLAAGAHAKLSIQYDDGPWISGHTIAAEHQICTKALHITPHRCDHYALRLEGAGDILLYSIAKQYEEGSDYV